jgi:transcription antitermination factor NusG
MTEEKKWYAVYTKSRCEKKVADLLSKKEIENYCPVNRVYRQWSDRKKIVLEPLFTSYVFVNINEPSLFSVRNTDGVINFVYWLNKPAVIRNEEIDTIRRFLNEMENIQLEKVAININDSVRVIGGPLMEKKGLVVSVKNKSVKILLPSLGYMMYAEVKSSNIEIVTSIQLPYSEIPELQYNIK